MRRSYLSRLQLVEEDQETGGGRGKQVQMQSAGEINAGTYVCL